MIKNLFNRLFNANYVSTEKLVYLAENTFSENNIYKNYDIYTASDLSYAYLIQAEYNYLKKNGKRTNYVIKNYYEID